MLTDRPAIELTDLPEAVQNAVRPTETGVVGCSEAGSQTGLALAPREQQLREELISLLRVHRGNVSNVARAMSKGRNQVVRWMEKYQLDRHKFRNP
jgi:transcriptional regulator of acetoin/glycerol metabolism